MESETIHLKDVQIVKVQTMVDGGLRFTFDVSEDQVMQAAQLMECKRFGALLQLEITPKERKDDRRTEKRAKIHI